ncbi:hypothetical protein [Cypionkella sp.]|uniref:hypothetical protein n=1 Tax=Cypionkella sp. TaxID=2811411 RepID=UPI002AB81872|nr:hypothetical protein [Cypionkella sp.]MDZ4394896.1 hypothetical protein [Cypionkella sp.]
MLLASLVLMAAAVGGDACKLSADEEALKDLTNDRRVQMGDAYSFGVVESLRGPFGCGVWELEVQPNGSVADARLIRADAVGPYELYVHPFLVTQKYKPQRTPWTALVVIEVATPEN